jgi:hypothetical protein
VEQGSVRFRQMAAALASTGQSLKKVKVLLEDIEREWPGQSSVLTVSAFLGKSSALANNETGER